jgi:hypothetical protein
MNRAATTSRLPCVAHGRTPATGRPRRIGPRISSSTTPSLRRT